jgi:acyl-CoA reductase-like NAD-dependent aldehyde dehydrogenase
LTVARHNWIDARSCGAASGDGFEIAATSDRSRALGRWPRSGRADAQAALAAAAKGGAEWRQRPRSERAELLREAARRLDAAPDAAGLIAARLSLEPSELAVHVHGVGEVLARAISDERPELVAPPREMTGVAIHALHWSEIVREPARRIFSALAAGNSVVILSDRRLPMAADAIASALAAAGLPPGTWSLLHDDGATALRELLSHDVVDAVCAAAPRAELQRLARESSASPARTLELVPLCNTSHVVGLDDDPSAAAAHVVAAAFGRARGLSGQAPGQIGRVLCHERVFSKFTAALLAALETDRDIRHPIPPIDALAQGYTARVHDLGIDEGATLLHPRSFGAAPENAERLGALVFTNVDPFLRLAALSRPAPCVCLMRVVSDGAGAALARSFDAPVEVLSGSAGEPDGDLRAM